jgi:hypothetical protein
VRISQKDTTCQRRFLQPQKRGGAGSESQKMFHTFASAALCPKCSEKRRYSLRAESSENQQHNMTSFETKLQTRAKKASRRCTSTGIHFCLTMEAKRCLLSRSASAEGFELPSARTCQ